MITLRMTTKVFLLLLAAALACFPILSLAAEVKKADDISAVLERSSLSIEEKTSLETKARETEGAGIDPGDIAIILERGLSHGLDGRTLEAFLSIQ